MSADAVAMGCYPVQTTNFHEAVKNVKNLEELICEFGVQEIASVMANEDLEQAIKEMKQLVQDSGFPQSVKDRQLQFLDDSLSSMHRPVSPQAERAVEESSLGNKAESTGGHSGGGHSLDAADLALAANKQWEESQESSEGSGSSSKQAGGNWLLELAKGLARIQEKFLDSALESLKIMDDNAGALSANLGGQNDSQSAASNGDDKSGGDEGVFLMAQAKYQASMQMFTMMANMTATSLKTLGEGLTAIARKQ